jgi:hypothetical protein
LASANPGPSSNSLPIILCSALPSLSEGLKRLGRICGGIRRSSNITFKTVNTTFYHYLRFRYLNDEQQQHTHLLFSIQLVFRFSYVIFIPLRDGVWLGRCL